MVYEKEIEEILKGMKKSRGIVGAEIDINIERLLTLALKQISVGYDSALYLAGFRSGKMFVTSMNIKTIDDLFEKVQEGFKKSGLGEVKSEKDGSIINVSKSSTSYGIKPVGHVICYFKTGFFAGAISEIKGKKVACIEAKCYAKGDNVCEFLIKD